MMSVPYLHITHILSISLSLPYPKQPPKFQILQWAKCVQSGCVLQAPAINQQPRQWRWRKQSGGGRGAAVQSESRSPPAIFPTFPHQSLWALLSDWLSLQAPAGCHHLHQPSAAQVKKKKKGHVSQLHTFFFTQYLQVSNTNNLTVFPKYYSKHIFLHVVFVFLRAGLLNPCIVADLLNTYCPSSGSECKVIM